MSSISLNPLFTLLSNSEKEYINNSIDFLYVQSHPETVSNKTQKAIDDALEGKNLLGEYKSAKDLMEALNA